MWAWILLYLLFSFCVSFFLLQEYGNLKKLHWYVCAAVLCTWCLNFTAVFLLPADITATYHRHCLSVYNSQNHTASDPPSSVACKTPLFYIENNFLIIVWKILYWFAQVATWLILPILQSYVDSAEFTFWKKLRSAIRDNFFIYLGLGLIFGACMIYIIAKKLLDFSGIVGIAMASSNTWGLACLVALLGYGIVEVPRTLFEHGRREVVLGNLYFNTARCKHTLDEVDDQLKITSKDVLSVVETMSRTDSLQKNINTLVEKIPEKIYLNKERLNIRPLNEDSIDGRYLVKLHKRLIAHNHEYARAESQFNECVREAIEVEDILTGKFEIKGSASDSPLKKIRDVAEYYYKMYIQIPMNWFMFVICSALTIIIIWSETLFIVQSPNLSIVSLAVQSFGINNHYSSLQMFVLTIVLYVSYCTFNTLFRIKIFNYFNLSPNHHSDAVSLVFSAVVISRLAPALVLNMLTISHMDGHGTSSYLTERTSFTQIMGRMEVVPFIASGFLLFFPMLMLIVSLLSFFKVFNRIIYDDEFTQDLVSEGKDYVRIERRRITGRASFGSDDGNGGSNRYRTSGGRYIGDENRVRDIVSNSSSRALRELVQGRTQNNNDNDYYNSNSQSVTRIMTSSPSDMHNSRRHSSSNASSPSSSTRPKDESSKIMSAFTKIKKRIMGSPPADEYGMLDKWAGNGSSDDVPMTETELTDEEEYQSDYSKTNVWGNGGTSGAARDHNNNSNEANSDDDFVSTFNKNSKYDLASRRHSKTSNLRSSTTNFFD